VRGSRYRGVSKNGNKWQVLVMGNQKKQYSGSIRDETTAARLYDKFAIKNLGLRAKTNFDYKRQDLIRIIREVQDEDSQFGETSHVTNEKIASEGNSNVSVQKSLITNQKAPASFK